MAATVPLFVSFDADQRWLSALPFGVLAEGVVPARWEPINDHAGWLLATTPEADAPAPERVGVDVTSTDMMNLDDDEWAPCFESDGPRFAAPALGLSDALIGEILLAAQVACNGRSTYARMLVQRAGAVPHEQAVTHWQRALQAGDLASHLGIGRAYYELGDYRRAYRHLRFYAELAPEDAAALLWLGKAAAAIEQRSESLIAWTMACSFAESNREAAAEAEHLLFELLNQQVDPWADVE